MPDRVSEPFDAHDPDPYGPATEHGRAPVWPVLAQAVAVLAMFALGGLACGWLWHWWWEPVRGVVSEGDWFTDEAGLRGAFSGTALYVLVAVVGGVVLGVVSAYLFDRSELVTLLAVTAGAMLAAWLMWRVGTELGPPDPERLAQRARDGARLPDDLDVSGRSPFAAYPVGALCGLAAVFLVSGRRPRRRP